MRSTLLILLLSGACFSQLVRSQANFNTNYFRAPMDIEMYLSGNFGELRSNHFHSGIDIKTQGVIGKRVFSTAGGYISRIKIEAAGYGNTLYITHPGGYTTVYAHLDRFRKDIADYVRKKQYDNQQHAVNIFPGKDEWPVEKGEMVAFSGTSGYSFGPHLHFEIRDASNQVPMNALLFGLDIKDNISPTIFSLYLYPGNKTSFANQSHEKSRIEVKGENGRFRLASGDTIRANGSLGFGLEAFDYLNGARNRCGIYRIRMLVDGQLKYEWEMDRFPFSRVRYVNSYIDYEEKIRNSKLVQKAFIDPNNKLQLYQNVENAGILEFSEARLYKVRFILDDAHENSSELEFYVSGDNQGILTRDNDTNDMTTEFPWSADNEFSLDDVVLNIPVGALYKTLDFRYEIMDQQKGTFSPLYSFVDPYTPLQLACDLGIRAVGLPPELQEKALIGVMDEEGELGSAGGEWKDSMVWTQVREFGKYTIMVDTTVPKIHSVDLDGSGDEITRKTIRFKVSDEISGIKSYEGYIDNQWVLFEYDLKNDLVFYRIDPERLSSGKDHELELYIIDNKENIAYYYAEFYW